MKIYTKTGDNGETGLFGGTRLSKGSPRIAAYGDVDELNSVLGIARVHRVDDATDALLASIQAALFTLGAELATTPGKEADLRMALLSEGDVEGLEHAIDAAEVELAPLKNFVLPGGTAAAAHLHLARTVCRRAERHVVELGRREPVRETVVHYLNRLSNLLFVLARLANHRAGVADVPWAPHGARGAV